MKPAQHLLIYDNDCPFCCWYTNLFIHNGLLANNERIPYSEAVQDPELHFNHDKARNKIAFVATRNGEITYGIDSLLTIIGRKFPAIKHIGKFLPVHFLLGLLYNFLSYNRKVIAAVDCQQNCGCSPEKSYVWRFSFIAGCYWLFDTAISLQVTTYNKLLISHLNIFICFVTLYILQVVFFKLLGNKHLYDYLGHLSFVLIIGSFLLIFNHFTLQFLSNYSIEVTELRPFLTGCALTVTFFLHRKRLRLLHASPILQFTLIFLMISPAPFLFNLLIV